jgi:ubiquinone/menaquinone biosynthesis C-methylase UbiE
MVGRELAILQKNAYLKTAYKVYGTLNVGGQVKHIYLRRAIKHLDLPENAKILDAGCGTGLESFWLARKFPKAYVVGVEIFPDQIAALNKILKEQPVKNFRLEQEDLANLKYENEFDLVYCSAVLEHVENDEAVLQALYRSLKPGGAMLLDVPLLPQFCVLKMFKNIFTPLNEVDSNMGIRMKNSLVTLPSKQHSKSGLLWGPSYAYAGLDHAREGYDYARLINLVEGAWFSVKKTFQAYGFLVMLMWEIHEVLRWWNLRPFFFPFYFGLASLETLYNVRKGNKIHLILRK